MTSALTISERHVGLSLSILLALMGFAMAGSLSPWVVLIGFNLFCAWAVTGCLMGSTQFKECAEDPDALIAVRQVVASHFATVAAANEYGRDKT
ncbi:hypothetical protein GCM10016455_28860 [Aliiroseovarius zhejiangensis]|uniref:Uncharacterized protein n=1 Tax=Aliiroseovarius zhejiangensis TaxID=1632025 RepID=A0ABQ3J707_9RHOB|nr:hexameric tyrosine-coordinated heme protein [Aliiroseovarius zhejiangensis]GHF05940.1 hypothetical protein GCM10016455_28860 [Aliiroseovarius zhejiangensis]